MRDLASQWSQIQRELNVIADAYNLGYNNGGYRNDQPSPVRTTITTTTGGADFLSRTRELLLTK